MAIDALKFDIDQYCKEHFCVMVDKDVWDKAEKALEQEPCEDAISRQDALDCLTANGLKKFDFILDARDKIKNLPSVKPEEPILDNIRAEIREFSVVDESGTYRIMTYIVNQIIDKYRGKVDCRECKVEHDCYECEKYRESEG